MIDRHSLNRRSQLLLPKWTLPAQDSVRHEVWRLRHEALQVLFLILLVGIVTFILYLYLLPTSQMSAGRARIEELKAEKAALIRENAELAKEISYYTDLTLLEYRARQLGMGPPANAVFLRADPLVQAPAGQHVEAKNPVVSTSGASGPVATRWLTDQPGFANWFESALAGGQSALEALRELWVDLSRWLAGRGL